MKKNILWILLELVFIILFNVIFFVAGGSEHPASVWISYAFIQFSYIMILATPFLVRKSNNYAILGFPLYLISSVYFLLEFVIGIVFIFIGSESYIVALLTQIIILGIYAILLLANIIANEYTVDNMERREEELAFIKENASRVKLLLGKLSDKKLNKELEKLYDLLHSSPVKSDNSVKNIELEVSNRIGEIETLIRIEDAENAIETCKRIIVSVEERNSILKSLH